MNEFKNDIKVFIDSLKKLKVDKVRLSLVILTMVISNIVILTNPFIYGKIINAVLQTNVKEIEKYFVLMIIVFIVAVIIQYINSRLLVNLTIDIEKKVKNKLFSAVMSMPYSEFLKIDKGTLLNNIENDATVYSNLLSNNLSLIISAISLIVSSAFMIFISPILTLIMLITFPLSGIIYMITGKKIKKNELEYRGKHDKLITFLNESLYGWKYIKLFNGEKGRQSDFQKNNDNLYKLEINKTMFQIKSGIAIDVLTFITNNINLVLGIVLIFTGKFSLGMLTAFNSYSGSFKTSLLSLTKMNSLIQETVVSLNRIDRILEFKDESDENKIVGKIREKIEKVTIENLEYLTSNGSIVFKNASVVFETNRIHIIKGPSGSGKSTLLDILCGLINNYTGKIWINDHDLLEIEQSKLREKIICITQENYLFSMSILDNITLYRDISVDDIIKTCKFLNLEEAINHSVDGLDTVINELGNNLSGGEKQRICILRAIVDKPDVFLFDEITSAIDEKNISDLVKIIEELSKDAIVIMTTHEDIKFSLPVKNYYIDNGNIAEVNE